MQRSPSALARLGLEIGEPVRFRRTPKTRRIVGNVAGIEADGSIVLRDPDGSLRSFRPEEVDVRRPGSQGRPRWSLVSDVAVTWEQLAMFADDATPPAPPTD